MKTIYLVVEMRTGIKYEITPKFNSKNCFDQLNLILKIIQRTMNRTRIYVFLGSSTSLLEMMTLMDSLQLFSKGEYMVIFVDVDTYSLR